MRLAVEQGPRKFNADFAACAHLFCQAGKQLARSCVGGRHGGFQIAHLAQVFAMQKLAQHRGTDALATELLGHRHLPDEQGVVAVGLEVTRNKAGQLAGLACDHTGVGKMPAQQQVGISGIVVQYAARAHQGFDVGAIAGSRLANLDGKFGIFYMKKSRVRVSIHWP